MLNKIREEFGLDKVDIRGYSPLALAYIGDAVFDQIIRSRIILEGNVPNEKLHKRATKYVSAVSQSAIMDAIMESLTEEELSVYRRGKNSKPASTAKNASLKDYLKATGFEAMIGYLYLNGQEDRIIELIKLGTDL